ncbi:hypothetical protein [Paenibacillus gorillae]|nr:hypothetical protein [Paenibacillus gorillae]
MPIWTAATLLTIVIVPFIYELLFFWASQKQRRVVQQSPTPQSVH